MDNTLRKPRSQKNESMLGELSYLRTIKFLVLRKSFIPNPKGFGAIVAEALTFRLSAFYKSRSAECRVRVSVKALSTLDAKVTFVNICFEEVSVFSKLTNVK